MKVNAKIADLERVVEVEYDFGGTLEEAVEKFGEDIVLSRFLSAAVIDLQNVIRRGIKAEKSNEEIEAIVEEWKPGVVHRASKDPSAKALGLLLKLSPEDRERLLAELLK